MATEAVIDSSVIVAIYTPEQFSEWARSKLDQYINMHTLNLAYYEVTNGILNKHRRGELTKEQTLASIENATGMIDAQEVHAFSDIGVDVGKLCMNYGIEAYDGAFISLAMKLNCRFLTLDTKLAKKLKGTPLYRLFDHP